MQFAISAAAAGQISPDASKRRRHKADIDYHSRLVKHSIEIGLTSDTRQRFFHGNHVANHIGGHLPGAMATGGSLVTPDRNR